MDERKSDKPAVFIVTDEKKCIECGQELFHGSFFLPEKDKGVLCVHCADLEELEYLPSGDMALTRRATKNSSVTYIVLKFSRARKRFERQGILVEGKAIDIAEEQCAADAPERRLRKERNQSRLKQLDTEFVRRFAEAVRRQYPNCPPGREKIIAEHACEKSSGRVGRTAAAKDFDAAAVKLAVIAHIRHTETNYDRILMQTNDRAHARAQIAGDVQRVLGRWEN